MEAVGAEMPKSFIIVDGDDKATIDRKKKLQKGFKSKKRLQEKEAETNKRQSSWLQFQNGQSGGGKGSKKRKLHDYAKQSSMFRTSEKGKVGVVGSGQGLTRFGERKKHEFQ